MLNASELATVTPFASRFAEIRTANRGEKGAVTKGVNRKESCFGDVYRDTSL